MSSESLGQDFAFPIALEGGCYFGLTKRQWFAGMAMQGLLSTGMLREKDICPVDVADLAVAMADRMCLELDCP